MLWRSPRYWIVDTLIRSGLALRRKRANLRLTLLGVAADWSVDSVLGQIAVGNGET